MTEMTKVNNNDNKTTHLTLSYGTNDPEMAIRWWGRACKSAKRTLYHTESEFGTTSCFTNAVVCCFKVLGWLGNRVIGQDVEKCQTYFELYRIRVWRECSRLLLQSWFFLWKQPSVSAVTKVKLSLQVHVCNCKRAFCRYKCFQLQLSNRSGDHQWQSRLCLRHIYSSDSQW